MPRRFRHAPGGLVYHALNRANARSTLFRKPSDYQAFEAVLLETHAVVPTRLLGWCIMPNHFHLVIWPQDDHELSEFMRRLTCTHAVRWHAHHGTTGSGHVYQNRFKSFPIDTDFHFLVMLRYVERNALRARLVSRAEDWRWGSLWVRHHGSGRLRQLLSPTPVELPSDWVQIVNEPQTSAEEQAARQSIRRSMPFGSPHWTNCIAEQLGMVSALRPRGRPRKHEMT